MNLQYIKRIVLSFVILVTSMEAFANHTKGGYMYYEYLGAGSGTNLRYRVTMKIYMKCDANADQIGGAINFTYFNRDNGAQIANRSINRQSIVDINNCTLSTCYPCFSSIPPICYKILTYVDEVELPSNQNGYTISYQRCCRIIGLINLQAPSNDIGATWTIDIPGKAVGVDIEKNNSAIFFNNDTTIVCKSSFFTMPFNATDVDNDTLRYEFVSAISGGSQGNSTPDPASAPPYGNVNYSGGFSGVSPLGPLVKINQLTGVISGIAPAQTGEYVISVLVTEIRNGVKIAQVRKEIHMSVGDCQSVKPELDPSYITCDGFNLTFQNFNNNSLIRTYFWDFGVPSLTTDTSSEAMPTFPYPDTGTFVVKLWVNRGLDCSDSTTTIAKVYPGFFPGFITTGSCFQNPIKFTDTTKTKFGVVNTWRWDFGQTSVLNDTSRLQNPQYLYPDPGTKTVEFIVSNSKGCVDTVYKDIIVTDKPLITLPFKDTLICNIDTLQLQSSSFGNPTWSPNYRIDNIFSPTPKVNPQVTTTYKVTYNDNGCVGSDSIRVRVVDKVSLTKMPDTTVCLTDVVPLNITSDALRYLWSPPATILDPTVQDPLVEPVDPFTKYYVDAYIGKCSIRDSINVITNPYPLVDAGADKFLCYGKSVQLSGVTTGSSFKWSPLNGLTNFNTLTPTASPIKTTLYILTSVNSTGCIKPKSDTILVEVIPPILAFAGNDTSIVLGQPLQLNATGSINYLWSNVAPTAAGNFLSDYTIYNPIATLKENQTFAVIVSDDNGCLAVDTIKIVVFKSAPDIFVPTIFTPNNDGKNDRLIPIPVGLKAYDYFEIYNRWGQRMYRTSQVGVGWDGYFRGVLQDSDTYVWQVQGTDFLGKRVYKKGTAILMK
jgi:gliding motility-associated-like protein